MKSNDAIAVLYFLGATTEDDTVAESGNYFERAWSGGSRVTSGAVAVRDCSAGS